MSSWDHGEVLQLKTHGNDYARRVWLANAPEVGVEGRPREGSNIDTFKRFIVEVYENKRYYKEPIDRESYGQVSAGQSSEATPTSRVQSAGRTITTHKPNVALQQTVGFGNTAAPLCPSQPLNAAGSVSSPAPEVDLIDFGAFDSASASTTASVSNTQFVQPTTTSAPSIDLFDPFNTVPVTLAPEPVTNSMSMEATNPANSIGSGASSFDPFGIIATKSAPSMPTQTSNAPVINSNFFVANEIITNRMSGTMNSKGPMNGMTNSMMQNQVQQNMFQNNMMMNGINRNTMNSSNMEMMNTNNNIVNANNMTMLNCSNNSVMTHAMGTLNVGNDNIMSATPQPAMNINIMQPRSGIISNNFGSKPADLTKKDPFAGLGF